MKAENSSKWLAVAAKVSLSSKLPSGGEGGGGGNFIEAHCINAEDVLFL